jgi:hypothetical protein
VVPLPPSPLPGKLYAAIDGTGVPMTAKETAGASCKTIVGQRLKQAGMHWTVAGADAIIALRCKEASSQREAICNHRHNQTGAA